MEGMLNKAEYILHKSHVKLSKGAIRNIKEQKIYKKFGEIYADEVAKSSKLNVKQYPGTGTSICRSLLQKLVEKESLNCLLVNLHRGNEGYSLAIKLGNGIETETLTFSYENEEFISYLDNEQLPPMLLDIIDDANVNLFYSGCIVAEIRDHRRATDNTFECRYVLLKPNSQSLAADVAGLTCNPDWTSEERLHLESEIVKQTSSPLLLYPSPVIAVIDNKMHQSKYKLAGTCTKRAAKRYNQVNLNRQKKFEEGPAPSCLRLHGFLSSYKDKKSKTISKPSFPLVTNESNPQNPYEGKSDSEIRNLTMHIYKDVMNYSTELKSMDITMNDNSLVFVEEYTLETERGSGRIYLTKLTISQRRTDEIYFGELYVDRDYQEGMQNGSICKFKLGMLHQVQRYIKQFKEILTEEGRKTVKITHKVAGQPPRIAHTQGTPVKDKKEITEEKINKPPILIQQQEQQFKTGILNSIPVNISGNSNVSIPLTSMAQSSASNIYLVSSTDGTLKKTTMNMAGKPIAVTSSSTLTNLLTQSGGQQLIVGQTMNLSTLLNGRQIVSSRSSNLPSHNSTGPTKLAVNVTSGDAGAKICLPSLTAQLNRSNSQSLAAQLNQPIQPTVTIAKQLNDKPDSSSDGPGSNANLEALLAGSVNNSNTLSKNATLLERLTATSVMLNPAKLQESNLSSTHKIGGTIGSLSNNCSNVTAANIIRSEGTGIAPPNINLANITNLPGLNVSLQSLATSLPGIQNVQVSFPGFTMPLSLSVQATNSTITSLSNSNVMPKTCVTTVVSSTPATVMIASPSGLQGQVVQLPIGQITSPQLAAQLAKGATQGSSVTSNIQNLSSSGGEITMGTLSHSSTGPLGSSIVTLTSKQPMTMEKKQSGQIWLQQKQSHAKR